MSFVFLCHPFFLTRLGARLLGLGQRNSDIDCLGSPALPFSDFKFYLLPFIKRVEIYPLNGAAMEEQALRFCSLNEAESSILI